MRKDVIQQRFRRKNNNSKDESSNGNSPMDTAQSFVFQTSANSADSDDHHSQLLNSMSTDQLIKSFSAEHNDTNELQGNEFVKWNSYIPSSQASTPSSTNEPSAELTQNLLASLMNPKNLICDIGV
jgi:hypothetical protein